MFPGGASMAGGAGSGRGNHLGEHQPGAERGSW